MNDVPPLEELDRRAVRAAELMRLLANERRLQIRCVLRNGERSVGDLAAAVGLSPSALSQHLARLRAEQLVAPRRRAQTVFYRIADFEVLRLLQTLSEVMARRTGGRAEPGSSTPASPACRS